MLYNISFNEVSMKQNAFTLIEIIIVIFVIGVLSITIMPRLERDPLREAVNQITRHINYTQHMAMVDDVYNASQRLWFKAMWRISFRSKNCYVVSSNIDLDTNYDREESVMDPLTKTLLYSNVKCEQEETDSSTMFLSDKYNIDKIIFTSACGDNRFIAFDNFGRPHKTLINSHDFLKEKCEITLLSGSRKGVITILPETGYVQSDIIN